MTGQDALALCLKLTRVTARVTRTFDHRLSALHGLSLHDFVILYVTQQAPGGKIRRSDLAAQLGVTASAVTRLLLPLEKIGLMARLPDPRDARVSYAVLTPAGHDLLGSALQTAAETGQDLMAPVPSEDWAALSALLGVLA